MVVWCGVRMGLLHHPLSLCGRLRRRPKEITGRSCTGFMSLTRSEKGNRGWRGWKGNVPFVRNGTPGGKKWAGGLWRGSLVSALGWPLRSIRPDMAGRRARCSQRAGRPRRSIMGEEEWSQLGLSPTAPTHITVQTARVNWLYPNKQANTENSLVSSYENFRKGFHCRMLSNLCIQHCITLNNWLLVCIHSSIARLTKWLYAGQWRAFWNKWKLVT